MLGGGIKEGWHKVLKMWGGIKGGGIRFVGGGIKRGWHKNMKKIGGWHKKGGIKKKTNAGTPWRLAGVLGESTERVEYCYFFLFFAYCRGYRFTNWEEKRKVGWEHWFFFMPPFLCHPPIFFDFLCHLYKILCHPIFLKLYATPSHI